MEEIIKIIEEIKLAQSIVIISHVGPDGDTLGSQLALKMLIDQINPEAKVDMVVTGKIPAVYEFLPLIELTKQSDDERLYNKYDLAISVDVAAIDRLGDALELYKNARKTINIDHHRTNNGFGDINFIEADASSTGEVIFDIVEHSNINLTHDMAVCMFTAIVTDTGGFKFENTSAKTFVVASKLIEAGVKVDFVNKKCFDEKPMHMVKLHAWAVDNAVFEANNTVAYSIIKRADLERFGASDEHIDGISETLRKIQSVQVAFVAKETTKGDTKISLRSNDPDVAKISEFFGGGGHRLAAGCTIHKTPEEAVNEVLPIVIKEVEKLTTVIY